MKQPWSHECRLLEQMLRSIDSHQSNEAPAEPEALAEMPDEWALSRSQKYTKIEVLIGGRWRQYYLLWSSQMDTNYIKLEREQFSVGDLLNWFVQDGLDLTPRFQRRPVWKAGAKSFLIDTVLRGLPVPPVILRDRGTDLRSLKTMREVVDGQQRLRTLFSFVRPDSFKLANGARDTFVLQRAHQPDYPKANYESLPNDLRRRILDYRLIAHIFPIATEDSRILEVFARLNATGTPLKPQELRNARFYGEFKSLCFSLATSHLSFWLDFGVFSHESLARMDEVELTSDLVLIIIRGIGEGGKTVLDRAYSDYDSVLPAGKIIGDRFSRTISMLRERFDFTKARRFRNKSLFYCLFAAFYDALYGLGSTLNTRTKPNVAENEFAAIQDSALKIMNNEAPIKVLYSTQRRLTHKSERTVVTNFLRRGRQNA